MVKSAAREKLVREYSAKRSVEEHRAQASLGYGVEIETKIKKTISFYKETVTTPFTRSSRENDFHSGATE
jgi:hypothetical protein